MTQARKTTPVKNLTQWAQTSCLVHKDGLAKRSIKWFYQYRAFTSNPLAVLIRWSNSKQQYGQFYHSWYLRNILVNANSPRNRCRSMSGGSGYKNLSRPRVSGRALCMLDLHFVCILIVYICYKIYTKQTKNTNKMIHKILRTYNGY